MRAPYCLVAFVTLALLVRPGDLSADEPETKLPAILLKTLPIDAKEDKLTQLLKERFNAAVEQMKARYVTFIAGQIVLQLCLDPADRLVNAGLECLNRPEDRIALLEGHLELATLLEKTVKGKFDAGKIGPDEYHHARFVRLDSEIRLLRARQQLESAKKGND